MALKLPLSHIKISAWTIFTSLIIISSIIRLAFIFRTDLLVEEAYYWNYAMHLDFSYLDHPPMIALLIKAGTMLFGNTEIAVRLFSPLCWLGTVFFSYKLTECIQKGAGIHSLLLLSILPFFFIHSIIMTPDVPLLLAWSATLYYLYRAIIREENACWYSAGIWLGLGMISKYTIILLAFTSFIYLLTIKDSRKIFLKKEPWLAVILALIIFSPVIYWNASHEWISFSFQSTRRFSGRFYFSLHGLLGLLLLFLTPAGIFGLYTLIKHKNATKIPEYAEKTRYFMLYFTLIPLLVFGLFSLFREIKFNWSGPVMLAFIPWLSLQIFQGETYKRWKLGHIWFRTGSIILFLSFCVFLILFTGQPTSWNKQLFRKFIDWKAFTLQIHHILDSANHITNPIIIPLDVYNMSSELSFYQAKLFDQGQIQHIYPVSGQHVFGNTSLMYSYWNPATLTPGQSVLLVGYKSDQFAHPPLSKKLRNRTTLQTFWMHGQGNTNRLYPFYYQLGTAI